MRRYLHCTKRRSSFQQRCSSRRNVKFQEANKSELFLTAPRNSIDQGGRQIKAHTAYPHATWGVITVTFQCPASRWVSTPVQPVGSQLVSAKTVGKGVGYVGSLGGIQLDGHPRKVNSHPEWENADGMWGQIANWGLGKDCRWISWIVAARTSAETHF